MRGQPRRSVVINADDFGISVRSSEKILEVWRAGSLTSLSVCVCSPHFERCVELLQREKERLPGVGLHFTLTELFPVVLGRSALVRGGRFREREQVLWAVGLGRVSRAELREELQAQWEKLVSTGITADHINSHQHIHMHPRVFSVVVAFAQEKKVAVRLAVHHLLIKGRVGIGELADALVKSMVTRAAAGYCRWRYGELAVMNTSFSSVFDLVGEALPTPQVYLRLARQASGALHELMTHPYGEDEQLRQLYSYKWERKRRFLRVAGEEYECLRGFSLCELLSREGFRVVSYGEWVAESGAGAPPA